MFLQFFGLKFNPFTKEIESQDLFESEDMKELFSRLKYMQQSRGIFLIVGEPGTGKTTAIRKFCASLNPGTYKPCYFTLSTVTVMDFYRGLLLNLGEMPSCKKITMFKQIQDAICNLYYEQKITPVIILDEVHLASSNILEDLRLLFSFKMDSENPFILILSGQSIIRNKLQMSVNSPLKQRISLRHNVKGLQKDELGKYLDNRMALAGLTEKIFTPEAVEAIFSISKGAPRMTNNLATASLMYAASKKLSLIDEETVYQGQRDWDM